MKSSSINVRKKGFFIYKQSGFYPHQITASLYCLLSNLSARMINEKKPAICIIFILALSQFKKRALSTLHQLLGVELFITIKIYMSL